MEGKMAKAEQDGKSKNEADRKSKTEEDRQLSKELEMSFPASDPPAATQPGSGVTGPAVASSEAKAGKMKGKPPRRS
jgi:hypothetical protein